MADFSSTRFQIGSVSTGAPALNSNAIPEFAGASSLFFLSRKTKPDAALETMGIKSPFHYMLKFTLETIQQEIAKGRQVLCPLLDQGFLR